MNDTYAKYLEAAQPFPKGKPVAKHNTKNPMCIDCRDLTKSTEKKEQDKLLCRCTYYMCQGCNRIYNNTCGDIDWCMCKEEDDIEWDHHQKDHQKNHQKDHCNLHPKRRLGSRCSLDVVTHTKITNDIAQNLAL
jgi:hypothetical protein